MAISDNTENITNKSVDIDEKARCCQLLGALEVHKLWSEQSGVDTEELESVKEALIELSSY